MIWPDSSCTSETLLSRGLLTGTQYGDHFSKLTKHVILVLVWFMFLFPLGEAHTIFHKLFNLRERRLTGLPGRRNIICKGINKVRKGQEVLGKSDLDKCEVRLCPILAVQYRNAISLSGLSPYLKKSRDDNKIYLIILS